MLKNSSLEALEVIVLTALDQRAYGVKKLIVGAVDSLLEGVGAFGVKTLYKKEGSVYFIP